MKHVTPFVISEFTNPSGDVVYRVSGWLDGQRVRKNFSTRAEAEAERQALKLAQIQAETGVRIAATRLTDDQLKEAEGAFLRLEGRTRSLSFYLDLCAHQLPRPGERQARRRGRQGIPRSPRGGPQAKGTSPTGSSPPSDANCGPWGSRSGASW